MTFLLFNGVMLGTRLHLVIQTRGLEGYWQYMLTGLLESFRLLCAGLTGVTVLKFSYGRAAECHAILQETVTFADLAMNLPRAWAARERSLAMSAGIRKHLAPVLTVALFADMLCLNAVLCNFLTVEVTKKPETFMRLVVSVLLYCVSIQTVIQAMLSLTEIVSAVQ
ncbi:hypothetical protein BV898_06291 [Hypsibius exemplaris]|uniref:Uncharacterized protein n=1 Tax=Hypsibius exemplaris TaxID=2072580 RepID=A0A1W0WX72_HYPEX|nr:hypothetical protein BV898_06291 [Hypsibius exemplaris]